MKITKLLSTIAGLAFLLTAPPPRSAEAEKKPRQLWTANLTAYGYPSGRRGRATVSYSDTAIAATHENIAVALNVEASDASAAEMLRAPWQLSLLIFSADDGKLRGNCGPWKGGIAFELWATQGGDFLLYQDSSPGMPEKGGGQISLLSPSCQVLGSIQLPREPHGGTWFLLSPSRRRLLVETQSDRDMEYELRDANTLAVGTRWFDTGSRDPRVIAISDDGMLGVKPANSKPSTSSLVRLFYRDFQRQEWREIPEPNNPDLRPVSTIFLSNGAFLETATIGALGPCATSDVRIAVRKIDGTPGFSTVISQRNLHIAPASSFVVSPTGNYFGAVLNFYSENSFWCFLDMSPDHDKAYVWSSQSSKPISSFAVGSSGSLRPQLAFAPDDAWFAVTDRGTLSVYPLLSLHTDPGTP